MREVFQKVRRRLFRVYERIRNNHFWKSTWGRLAELIVPNRFISDIRHLSRYEEESAIGPLQRSEAMFLYATAKVIQPSVVVEFGFLQGHSATTILKAILPSAKLYSFDISAQAVEKAASLAKQFPNFHFRLKSQADFAPNDVEGQLVDLVFLDAAHDLTLNIETWRSLLPSMAPNALVVIHDTGLWVRDGFLDVHRAFAESAGKNNWVTPDSYAHQPDERRFVNWIIENNPDFTAINFHTTRALRHGLTIIQRKTVLSV